MGTQMNPSAEPQQNVSSNGVAVELSEEAIRNLAGFFDVLIQMDLAQKELKKIKEGDDEKKQSSTDKK